MEIKIIETGETEELNIIDPKIDAAQNINVDLEDYPTALAEVCDYFEEK